MLLAVSTAQPVADAERAFATMAQMKGQWTAFRANAAPDAVMLAPELVLARDFLAQRRDPPASVMWWPSRTVTSCDGKLAFSTGPWRQADRSTGRFFTIWRHDAEGWRWIYDGGVSLAHGQVAGDQPFAVRASCAPPPGGMSQAAAEAGGRSPDGTLRWRIERAANGGRGYRLRVEFSSGRHWQTAEDVVVGR